MLGIAYYMYLFNFIKVYTGKIFEKGTDKIGNSLKKFIKEDFNNIMSRNLGNILQSELGSQIFFKRAGAG